MTPKPSRKKEKRYWGEGAYSDAGGRPMAAARSLVLGAPSNGEGGNTAIATTR